MKLRDYQIKLNDATKKFLQESEEQRGQVYAPTGAGKTVCFNELIKDAISRGKTKIAIVHPRLALSQDQLTRFQKAFGNTVRTASFHSGEHVAHDQGEGGIVEIDTTIREDLVKDINQTVTIFSKPHVTFTTYDSYPKLLDVTFDIIICDEAHYLVQNQFNKYLENMNADKILFYTATPVTDDMEEGMKDFNLFGEVIAQVAPRELIERGYIVAPLVHTLVCNTNKKAEKADAVDIIARAYVHQHKEITENGMPYHQMLVACRDVQIDIRETINARLSELWAAIDKESGGKIRGVDVDVYTVTSDRTFKNGHPVTSRASALKEIKNSGKNVILAHYDTVSEGIDIDTLSGVLIMREMTKAKLIQTIGRASRPYVGDLDAVTFEPRTDLFDLSKNIDTRKKRRSIITFPTVDGVFIAGKIGKQVAEAFIIAGYGELMDYMPSAIDKPTGKKDGDDTGDQGQTFLSDVVDHRIERELVDLRQLFDFND